jgi:hypothetical protein
MSPGDSTWFELPVAVPNGGLAIVSPGKKYFILNFGTGDGLKTESYSLWVYPSNPQGIASIGA